MITTTQAYVHIYRSTTMYCTCVYVMCVCMSLVCVSLSVCMCILLVYLYICMCIVLHHLYCMHAYVCTNFCMYTYVCICTQCMYVHVLYCTVCVFGHNYVYCDSSLLYSLSAIITHFKTQLQCFNVFMVFTRSNGHILCMCVLYCTYNCIHYCVSPRRS